MYLKDDIGNDKKGWISVIIPTFNRATRLPRAVESCLSQPYDRVEVIVIDDGSKDNTPEVLYALSSKWGKDHFRWFRQENKGACLARNLGLEKMKGEFVQFLDSDDLLLPDKFVIQTEALVNSNFPITVCDFAYVDEDLRILNVEKNEGDLREKLLRFHGICISTPLIRSASIPAGLYFRPEITCGQDVDFFIRYFLGIDGWIYTPGVWAQYVMHSDSRISDTYNQGIQYRTLYWSMSEYWKKSKSELIASNKWMLRQYALNTMSAFHEAGNFRIARLYGMKALLPPFSRNRLYGVVSELASQIFPQVLQNAIRKWKNKRIK